MMKGTLYYAIYFIYCLALVSVSSARSSRAEVVAIHNSNNGELPSPTVTIMNDDCTATTTTSSSRRMAHPQRRSFSLDTVVQLPRGGAWYFGKKTAARKYRELLEDQVKTLDRQLRQSNDELTLLRRQLKTSQTLLHKTGSPALRTKSSEQQSEKLKTLAENNELKKKITNMAKEVSQLEKMRDDLQAVIDQQHKRMEELEEKLKNAGNDNERLVEKYEQQMEKLKRDIDAKYQKQIEELTKLYERRVEEAEERGRQAVLRDVEARVERATAEERAKYERLLADERKKSEAAIEREKVKMRKLAKALFEREKKLNTLDKDLSNLETVKGQSSIPNKTGQTTHSVNTVRKF